MGLAHGLFLDNIYNEKLISIFDAANPKCTTGSGNINDLRGSLTWDRFNTVNNTVQDGIPCFDMDNGYIETGSRIQLGQFYTCFHLWKPRATNTGWRTMYRNDNDHIGIIQDGTTNLGMYSNRNGGFRDSGYNITPNVWQTWIFVGTGNSATDTVGTTAHYVNGVFVGNSDRVGCGTNLYRFGWPGQGPGKISIAGMFNRAFNATEVQELHNSLYSRVRGNA